MARRSPPNRSALLVILGGVVQLWSVRRCTRMAHYLDLSVCDYVASEPGSRCLAVGWLDPAHEFTRGDVAPEFFERLCRLLVEPWTFVASAGVHPCGFFRFSGGGSVSYKSYHIQAFGSSMLFVSEW